MATNADRPRGIILVAVLMILFGLAEIITGFTHDFFGLTTSQVNIATYLGVALGVCYFAGAIALLGADFIGRIVMVLAGLYPVDSFRQAIAIVIGTAVAGFFAIYIAWKWHSFS